MKVLVLGSGVIGVTSAYQLALAGHEVTVVDRQPAAALETSYGNAGEVSPGYSAPWAGPGVPIKAIKWLLMRHRPLVIDAVVRHHALVDAVEIDELAQHRLAHALVGELRILCTHGDVVQRAALDRMHVDLGVALQCLDVGNVRDGTLQTDRSDMGIRDVFDPLTFPRPQGEHFRARLEFDQFLADDAAISELDRTLAAAVRRLQISRFEKGQRGPLYGSRHRAGSVAVVSRRNCALVHNRGVMRCGVWARYILQRSTGGINDATALTLDHRARGDF